MRGDCAEAVTFPPALYSLGIRSLDWGMREVRIPHQGQPPDRGPKPDLSRGHRHLATLV
jgi:hypothetical protein